MKFQIRYDYKKRQPVWMRDDVGNWFPGNVVQTLHATVRIRVRQGVNRYPIYTALYSDLRPRLPKLQGADKPKKT